MLIHHYLREKRGWMTHIHNKYCYIALIKLISRPWKILWLKSDRTSKEQTGKQLQLIIEKTSCRQKRSTIDKFLQILVHADMMTTKRGASQQKISRINPFVIKSVLESNCERFSKSSIPES